MYFLENSDTEWRIQDEGFIELSIRWQLLKYQINSSNVRYNLDNSSGNEIVVRVISGAR